MKILKVFMFMIFGFIVISNVYGKAQEAKLDWEKNEFGKVVGWIIDPETNEPVNEKFNLRFFYIDPKIDPKKPFYFNAVTDQNGFFSRKLLPGKYYVHSEPIRSSKYCFEPYPYKNLENAYIMDIKNGQITKIYKKASIGGNLKVILVDPEGRNINVQDVFQNHKFEVSISNKKTGVGVCKEKNSNNSSDNGEFLFKNFAPGKYIVKFMSAAGVVSEHVENVIIEKNKTTEYELTLDIFTGIEGIITNEHGQPLDAVWVDIRSQTDSANYNQIFTYEDGYYRFIGLEEGTYNLDYFTDDENEVLYGNTIRNITIKKNVIIIKNLVLEMDKSTE